MGNLLREEHQDLLNSLRRYIEHDCNQKDAAKALFCHVNTLYFRLKKIERMLHRSDKNWGADGARFLYF